MAPQRPTRRNPFTGYRASRISRRAALRGAGIGAAGLAGAVLIGCSDSDEGASTPAAGAGGGSGGGETAATPTSAPEEMVSGGSLIHGIGAEVLNNLDPSTGQSGGEHKYFWTMFDSLVDYNPSGVPDPAYSLAESWEIQSPTTIAFTLRQGVKFHNGEEFNAEVVKWNVERIQDPATKSAAAGQMAPIATVEVVDDSHVTFELERPKWRAADAPRGSRWAAVATGCDRGGGRPVRSGTDRNRRLPIQGMGAR